MLVLFTWLLNRNSKAPHLVVLLPTSYSKFLSILHPYPLSLASAPLLPPWPTPLPPTTSLPRLSRNNSLPRTPKVLSTSSPSGLLSPPKRPASSLASQALPSPLSVTPQVLKQVSPRLSRAFRTVSCPSLVISKGSLPPMRKSLVSCLRLPFPTPPSLLLLSDPSLLFGSSFPTTSWVLSLAVQV